MSASRAIRSLLSASVVALAALPTPAAAQQVDRIVSFGDSYADTGIAVSVLLNDPLFPAPSKSLVQTLYPTGRFSGSKNYVDILASSAYLNVPVENYAVGGALAGTFPVPFGTGASNNTNCGPGVIAGSPDICPLGFTYEVNQFTNVGTQDPRFPTGSGTFDANDLVVVSIGGNDARYYQLNYSALPSAPFIAGSIAGATAGLDQLVAAGAPTISFLAGDTGRLPEVLGDPTAQAIRSSYSAAFNTAMQSTLAGYAADGVIVHYLDLNTVLDNILANPVAYGITQGSAATNFTCPTPSPAAPGCLLNPVGYLFYVDGLHLTATGFEIVAQYINAQLDGVLSIRAPGDLAIDTAREFGRVLTSRVDTSGRGPAEPGLRFFAVGDTYSRDLPESDFNHRFDIDGVGGTAGVEYGFGGGMVGVAGNYTHPRVSFGNDSLRIRGRSFQIGAYGSFGMGGLFGQAYAGYGSDRQRLRRSGVVNDLKASPNGDHVVAGAKAGYLFPLGSLGGILPGLSAGPIAALDYARAKIDGYAETGDAALRLDVDRQTIKGTTGQLGLEARTHFSGISPYFSVAAERQLSGNSRTIVFAQTASPTIVNHWDVDPKKETYGRFTSGASAQLWEGTALNWSLSRTFGKDEGQEMGLQIGFKTGF